MYWLCRRMYTHIYRRTHCWTARSAAPSLQPACVRSITLCSTANLRPPNPMSPAHRRAKCNPSFQTCPGCLPPILAGGTHEMPSSSAMRHQAPSPRASRTKALFVPWRDIRCAAGESSSSYLSSCLSLSVPGYDTISDFRMSKSSFSQRETKNNVQSSRRIEVS
jgi:hypothetical protein